MTITSGSNKILNYKRDFKLVSIQVNLTSNLLLWASSRPWLNGGSGDRHCWLWDWATWCLQDIALSFELFEQFAIIGTVDFIVGTAEFALLNLDNVNSGKRN